MNSTPVTLGSFDADSEAQTGRTGRGIGRRGEAVLVGAREPGAGEYRPLSIRPASSFTALRSSGLRLAVGALALAFWLAGCDTKTDIRSTIPKNDEENVDTETTILIRLSDPFTEGDDKDSATLNGAVRVEGAANGRYNGTVTLQTWADARAGVPAEVEEPEADDETDETDTPEPPRVPGAPGTQAEDDTEEEDDDSGGQIGESTDLDTLVFRLAEGERFLAGERIKVRVDDLVVQGLPIDGHTFHFFTRTFEPSSPTAEDFRVASTTPSRGRLGISLRPRVRVAFTRAAAAATLNDHVTVRGDRSGVRTLDSLVLTRTEGEGAVLELSARTRPGLGLIAGEWVTATLDNGITAAAPGPNGTSPARLEPYSFRFQAVAGLVTGGWESAYPIRTDSRALAVAASNVDPNVNGVEFAILSTDALDFFRAGENGVFDATRIDDFGERTPVDVALADVDRDGVAEVLTLLASAEGSRVTIHGLGFSGELEEKEAPLDLPADRPIGMTVVDLDSNGHLDILVRHENRTYTSGNEMTTRNTGFLTLLERSPGQPRPEDLAAGRLEGPLVFQRVDDLIKGGTQQGALNLAPLRVEAVDLDADGMFDLVLETAQGLSMYRNAIDPTLPRETRFRFQFTRALKDSTRTVNFLPIVWTTGDIDGDQDMDILAWDARGPALFENSLDPTRQREDDDVEPRGLFFEDALPTRLAVITPAGDDLLPLIVDPRHLSLGDADGDLMQDVVLAQRNGKLRILQVIDDEAIHLESRQDIDTLAAGDIIGAVPADVDGDTGLDFVLISDVEAGINGDVVQALGVSAPTEEVPSSYRIDLEQSRIRDTTISVVVTADVAASYEGFKIALDYNDQLLDFTSFEGPSRFESKLDVTSCSGTDCPSFVAVNATLDRTVGVAGENVIMGTFHFTKREVQREERTTIALASDLLDATGTTRRNALVVREGEASVESEVRLEGEAMLVALSPPAEDLLTISECTVTDVSETGYAARVAWMTPGDPRFSPFSLFEVTFGPERRSLDRMQRSLEFVVSGETATTVTVRGFAFNGLPLATASCEVAGIFAPQDVTCRSGFLTDGSPANQVEWTPRGVVDGFQIYRNGLRLATVGPETVSYVDVVPSRGADLYEVAAFRLVDGMRLEGRRAECAGGAVGEDNRNVTDPPARLRISLVRANSPSAPNALQLRWENGEAYDETVVGVFAANAPTVPVFERRFLEPVTEFLFEGDPDAGGVRPHRYFFTVVGIQADRESEVATSINVDVQVPALPATLSCEPLNGNNAHLTWDLPWQGYDSLEVATLEGGRVFGDPIPVPLTQTEVIVEEMPSSGDFTFVLRARYDDPTLPAALRPSASRLERTCQLAFEPSVRLGSVETGIGLSEVMIPIRASLFGELEGFTCAVELPGFLSLAADYATSPAKLLRLSDPDATIAELDVSSGGGRHVVTIAVTGASYPPNADLILGSIVVAVPASFDHAGSHPLRFQGTATHTYAGAAEATPVARDDDNGELFVHRRFIAVGSVSATANAQAPVVVRVHLTSDDPPPPPGVGPYAINGYLVHFKYDPALLERLPTEISDQASTAIKANGIFVVGETTPGDVNVFWSIAGADQVFRPGINQPILVLKFRAKTPRLPGGETAPIRLVRPGERDATTLFTIWTPNEGKPLEGFFDGAVEIASSSDSPVLLEVDNRLARGSLVGGSESIVSGIALTAGVTDLSQLKLSLVRRDPDGPPVRRAVTEFVGMPTENLIHFVVPSAGPKFYSPMFPSIAFDVELETPKGRSILANAYTYDFLVPVEAEPSSGRSAGGERIVLTGRGFAPTTEVTFVVGTDSLPAVVEPVEGDGTSIVVTTPNFGGHAGETARIDIRVPIPVGEGGDVTEFRGFIDNWLVTDSPQVRGVSPATGMTTGGDLVEVTVAGFGPLAGKTVSVEFGSGAATDVAVVSDSLIRCRTPAAIGAGPVDVHVIVSGASVAMATLSSGFEYLEPTGELAITSVTPTSGSICGGDVLVIRGSGFTAQTRFTIGATSLTDIVIVSDLEARGTTPRVAEGTGEALIAAVDGATQSLWSGRFRYTQEAFIRGDVDGNGTVGITDVQALSNLGAEAPRPDQLHDRADVNDDGRVDGADFEYLRDFLFLRGAAIPAPFPAAGVDPTPDALTECGT